MNRTSGIATKDIRPGDIFSVPLKDGTARLIEALSVEPEAMNSMICGISNLSVKANTEIPAELDFISVQFVTAVSVNRGFWTKVGTKVPTDVKLYFNVDFIRTKGYVGVNVEGCGIIVDFLNAYNGLSPWDEMFDPEYYDALLLDNVLRPPNLILKNQTSMH